MTVNESLVSHPNSPRHEDSFHYELLRGHDRTDGSYKTDEQLRMEYIQRTDELIHKMTDGVEVKNPETGETELAIPDTVIFLDKSARPLAWMAGEMWEKLATDDDGNIPKKPAFRFLNIDREQWVNVVDPAGNGHMDIDKVDSSKIRSLRSIFINTNSKKDGLTEKIEATPASLDHKTIMVVDEVFSTGRTLTIAEQLISRAFPTAKVGGAYWMGGITQKGQAIGNADLPVWYKEKDHTGRGVDNRLRDPNTNNFNNLTQKFGAWFLSTRFDSPDHKSLQLRREIHELAINPDVPIRPSTQRYDLSDEKEFELYKARVERLNNKPFKDVSNEVMAIASLRKRR